MATENIIYTVALERLKQKGFSNASFLAKAMVAQAKHETGNFTSNHFKNSNNAFGYSYYAGSIHQIGAGAVADNRQKVGKYASVADSTKEVVDWIGRRKSAFAGVLTLAQYATALKKNGYYGDTLTNYLKGLTAFFKGDIKPAVTISGVAVIACLCGAVYLLK